MYLITFFKRFLYEDIKFFLLNNNSLVVTGKFGKILFFIKEFGFVKFNNYTEMIFLFLNRDIYSTFIKFFFRIYANINKLFFFKLRLKGLGYRMARVHKYLFRFFFAKNHFYYFYVPYSIYIRLKRRNFFVMSHNKSKLNDLFHHFMLLKKLDLYEKTNSFVMKDKILFLKKRK
jgi:hypothetical protein